MIPPAVRAPSLGPAVGQSRSAILSQHLDTYLRGSEPSPKTNVLRRRWIGWLRETRTLFLRLHFPFFAYRNLLRNLHKCSAPRVTHGEPHRSPPRGAAPRRRHRQNRSQSRVGGFPRPMLLAVCPSPMPS